ncbi:MAG: NADH-quinone oxidoreductase subunit J [Chloroflexi bacterium]|nr:MAG: hypothetical protein CUN54_03495 [Phototrophicales bacterium]RMF79431.1 MAG: NADH-quinone oxidoreductase subunit J [Chloroflexota bacterium]
MNIEITFETITFAIFGVLTLAGGIGVVTTRNLIHAALYLIVSLFGVAGIFILLAAPFLAAIQVLVYIGAIAILIIFGVMLTRGMTHLPERFNRQGGLAAVVVIGGFVVLLVGVILPVWGPNGAVAAEAQPIFMTTRDLGIALVDKEQFVLPFEVASVLLTAAMVGAIAIARDDESRD